MRHRGFARSALVVLAMALGLPGFAVATTQAEQVRLDVRPGFDGIGRENTPLPLTVLVESDGFFAGTLQILVQGHSAPVVVERAFELPAGSRKELTLLIPRPDIAGVNILDRQGRRVGSQNRSSVTTIRSEQLIGVLASAPPVIRGTTIPPLDQDTRVVPVTVEVVDLGSEALRALSHLVVDAKTAGALSPRQRETILGFAAAGGELIVAASSEAELAFLPADLRGSRGGELRRTGTGQGRVTVVLHPLSEAVWTEGGSMWSRALRPVDLRRWSADPQGFDLFEAIASSGGFGRASLGWLLAFVIGYVAIVGPLNFIILGRLRRRELAWITIPVLALLFAGGAYVAGRGIRNVPVLQGTGIVVVDRTARQELLALAVLSRSGGEERIRLQGSWSMDPLPFEGSSSTDQPVLRPGRDVSEVEFRLAVGAVGGMSASRVGLADSPAAGTLAVSKSGYDGSVTNPLDTPLTLAGVYVGTSFAPIGDFDAKAQTAVSVPHANDFVMSIEESIFRAGMDPSTASAMFPLLRRASISIGIGSPGTAFLVGLADLSSVGPSLGVGRVPGKVLIASPLRLDVPNSAQLGPSQAITRSVVAVDGFLQPGSPFEVLEAREAILRFQLPAAAKAKELSVVTSNLRQVFGGGGFIGKPVPLPVPGAPDQISQVFKLSVYDFAKGRWQALSLDDDVIELATLGGVGRFTSPDGEVFVRMASDFPTGMPIAGLELAAVLA